MKELPTRPAIVKAARETLADLGAKLKAWHRRTQEEMKQASAWLLRCKDICIREGIPWLAWLAETTGIPPNTAGWLMRRGWESKGQDESGIVNINNNGQDESAVRRPRPGGAEALVAGRCTVADLHDLAQRHISFATILADPAWPYDDRASRGAASNHYPAMPLEEIAALPIGQLAADVAHLHLWTTTSFLREAFDIIEVWGFTYKSVFVWNKKQLGVGHYYRVATEFLLLGVRGSARFKRRDLRNWTVRDRGRHSAKPQSIIEMIETVSPAPRLELFARGPFPRQGWCRWGRAIQRSELWRQAEAFGRAQLDLFG
jgi:N6-adenosine-specific RNA methylase IME4